MSSNFQWNLIFCFFRKKVTISFRIKFLCWSLYCYNQICTLPKNFQSNFTMNFLRCNYFSSQCGTFCLLALPESLKSNKSKISSLNNFSNIMDIEFWSSSYRCSQFLLAYVMSSIQNIPPFSPFLKNCQVYRKFIRKTLCVPKSIA